MKSESRGGPSIFGLIFTILSGVALGAALAVAVLLSTPVSKLTKAPDAEKPKGVGKYQASYFPGKTAVIDMPSLQLGLNQMERQAPGMIVFTEQDVNRFIGKFKAPGDQPGNARLGAPNVRIGDDVLHLSMALVVDPSGEKFELVMQSRARFESAEGGPRLVIDGLSLNSLKLDFVARFFSSYVAAQMGNLPVGDRLAASWGKVEEVTAKSGTLQIRMGRG